MEKAILDCFVEEEFAGGLCDLLGIEENQLSLNNFYGTDEVIGLVSGPGGERNSGPATEKKNSATGEERPITVKELSPSRMLSSQGIRENVPGSNTVNCDFSKTDEEKELRKHAFSIGEENTSLADKTKGESSSSSNSEDPFDLYPVINRGII